MPLTRSLLAAPIAVVVTAGVGAYGSSSTAPRAAAAANSACTPTFQSFATEGDATSVPAYNARYKVTASACSSAGDITPIPHESEG